MTGLVSSRKKVIGGWAFTRNGFGYCTMELAHLSLKVEWIDYVEWNNKIIDERDKLPQSRLVGGKESYHRTRDDFKLIAILRIYSERTPPKTLN